MLSIRTRISRGFTLIEVLVAMGILFFTSTAIIALSNALTQGTIISADKTVTNRWASEGLAILTKIRDDNLQASVVDTDGLPVWLAAAKADNGTDYGWYQLISSPTNQWELARITGIKTTIKKSELVNVSDISLSGQLKGYRLICLEAVAAVGSLDNNNNQEWSCNVDAAGGPLPDGLRTQLNDCQATDLYCQMTKGSLARQASGTKIIPAGNALKVRSLVIWQDREIFRSAAISTLLTNWWEFSQ